MLLKKIEVIAIVYSKSPMNHALSHVLKLIAVFFLPAFKRNNLLYFNSFENCQSFSNKFKNLLRITQT